MRIEAEEIFMNILLIVTCVLFGLALLALFLPDKADRETYSTSWSVVEGSSEKANVVKSQLGMERRRANLGRGGIHTYYEYTSYITIETESGKTGTFMRGQEDPIAGLSVGDSCTICIKRYLGDDVFGLTNGDTAYFINDVMVDYITEENLSKAFLKDFD